MIPVKPWSFWALMSYTVIRLFVQKTKNLFSALLIFIKFVLAYIIQVQVHNFKSHCQEKLTDKEKVHFTKWNVLKVNQAELLLFFIFKNVEAKNERFANFVFLSH